MSIKYRKLLAGHSFSVNLEQVIENMTLAMTQKQLTTPGLDFKEKRVTSNF